MELPGKEGAHWRSGRSIDLAANMFRVAADTALAPSRHVMRRHVADVALTGLSIATIQGQSLLMKLANAMSARMPIF